MTPLLQTYLHDVATTLQTHPDLSPEEQDATLEALREQIEDLSTETNDPYTILHQLPTPSSFTPAETPHQPYPLPAQTPPLTTPTTSPLPLFAVACAVGGFVLGTTIGIIGTAIGIKDAAHGGFVFFFGAELTALIVAFTQRSHPHARTALWISSILIAVSLLLPVLFPEGT